MRWWVGILAVVACLSANTRAESSVTLRPGVEANIREIRSRNPNLRDDVFAKMGGSSVESKAFLHCFASPHVDLGDHPDLQQTIDFFGTGRDSAFTRESRAAGVSWNLRYALGGRPANFRAEIAASEARWALVLFGANDAQNQNERIYARRLTYLVEELEAMGVVPVLGSASPRRNKTKDRWIRRFNAITEAVALHWDLPYVDYYGAMDALPGKGLARDGVHPNVLDKGGVRAACKFTPQGLRYGNNVRNLLTIEMLDALREVTVGASMAGPVTLTGSGGIPVSDPHGGVVGGTGTGTDAGVGTGGGAGVVSVPEGVPFSALVEKGTLSFGELPPGCGALRPGARVYRVSVSVSDATRLRLTALDLDGFSPRIFWVHNDSEGPRCVRRRTQSLEVAVKPGLWDLFVEVTERAGQDGEMLVLIDRDP